MLHKMIFKIQIELIYEGDVFGYNYNIMNIKSELFAQAEYSLEKFDFYAAVELSDKMFYRDGLYQTGRFPDNSLENLKHTTFSIMLQKAVWFIS
jgi:hypothetical protein